MVYVVDPTEPRGDVTGALAALLLRVARRRIEDEDREDAAWEAGLRCHLALTGLVLQARLNTDQDTLRTALQELLTAVRQHRNRTGKTWTPQSII
jgi:hypothetical protein